MESNVFSVMECFSALDFFPFMPIDSVGLMDAFDFFLSIRNNSLKFTIKKVSMNEEIQSLIKSLEDRLLHMMRYL